MSATSALRMPTGGLQAASGSKNSDLPPIQGHRFTLQPQEELRLELIHTAIASVKATSLQSASASRGIVKIQLQQGSCEVFGVELPLGQVVTCADGGLLCIPLFTWHGCVVDIDAPGAENWAEEAAYTSDETACNVAYVNTHAQLEAMREVASTSKDGGGGGNSSSRTNGPRVMIVGPPASGKSSLATLLASYACKIGRTPILVDLDPNDNQLTIPGTISANVVSASGENSSNNSNSATSGVWGINTILDPLPPVASSRAYAPLVYWHASMQPQWAQWQTQVNSLANCVDRRSQNDLNVASAGVIINTPPWQSQDGLDWLSTTIRAFKVNVVLVMGQDRLYSRLNSHVKGDPSDIKVIKLPRSGGVVTRPTSAITQLKARRLHAYFYGTLSSSHQLTPLARHFSMSELQVVQCSALELSAALLPVAAAQVTETMQVQTITSWIPSNEGKDNSSGGDKDTKDGIPVGTILAVASPAAAQDFARTQRASSLVASSIAGFVAVEKVNTDKDTVTLLCPCAGALPSNLLILGDITWME